MSGRSFGSSYPWYTNDGSSHSEHDGSADSRSGDPRGSHQGASKGLRGSRRRVTRQHVHARPMGMVRRYDDLDDESEAVPN